jgi:DNA polymerase-1
MRTPPLSTPLADCVVHQVRTDDDRTALWEWLQHEPLIAYDTETTGVGYFDRCRLLQLGNAQEAWVLDPRQHPDVVDELSFGGITLLAHNAAFDATVLGHLLADGDSDRLPGEVMNLMGSTVDTHVLAHLVDPRSQQDGGIGHGLKVLSDHYLGAGAVDGQTALKARFRELGLTMSTGWAEIPLWDQEYVIYAGVDAVLTYRLYRVLAAKVTELGLDSLSRFEMEVATVAAGMSARGIAVDIEHARHTMAHLLGEQATAESTALTMGVNNINSPAQVAEALMVRGVELTEKTDAGAWKMDSAVLDSIDDPLAKLVKKGKAARKASKNWIEPFLDHAAVDGRVHTRIRTLGARSGRMSATDPNLLNVPTGDWRIRRCLVADPNQSMISVDFAQIEPRVMCHLAGDQHLVEAFNRGEDIYASVATRLFGQTTDPKHRALAKTALLARLYGQSAKRMAVQTGSTEIECVKVMAALDRSYPRVARWSKRTIDKAKFRGGVMRSASGRVLPIDRGAEFKIVNHLCQSTAADVMKGALLEVHRAGYGDRCLLTIHDELLIQGDEFVADELGLIVADLMGGMLGDVPIVATHKVLGPSWGHGYMPVEVMARA